jgi:hypothetical protein
MVGDHRQAIMEDSDLRSLGQKSRLNDVFTRCCAAA